MSDAIMPGCWECPKCGFVLQKNLLHAGDGSVSADTSPLNQKCPNDGVLMVPLTWRKANHDLFQEVLKLSPVARAADALEDYLGKNLGNTDDWPAEITARGEDSAAELTGLLNELTESLKPYRERMKQ